MLSNIFCFRVLLTAADITLVYGRRYGLVGRNGLGKTTLLRMISRYVVLHFQRNLSVHLVCYQKRLTEQ
jgi:ATPase subunit of ABC transporter with duplicated ATPase domains